MTTATDGRQIEDLKDDEKLREMRLRYVGAIWVLTQSELRVTATRILATYPLTSEQSFVEMAREAFQDMVGQVALAARDAVHKTTVVK